MPVKAPKGVQFDQLGVAVIEAHIDRGRVREKKGIGDGPVDERGGGFAAMPPDRATLHADYTNRFSLGQVWCRGVGLDRPFVQPNRIIEERGLRRALNQRWLGKHKLRVAGH